MKNKIYEVDYNDISPLLKWVKPNSRVLEFGTGIGNMTKYLYETLSCRVTGIEYNDHMAMMAAKYTENMIVADLDTDSWMNEINGFFDFILFGDVLEHLREPTIVMQRALKYLQANGLVLISIPNIAHNAIIMCLTEGKFQYQQYGLLDNTHIHFFTRRSILQMMKESGLICLEEDNRQVNPALTEFQKYYFKNIFRNLSLIRLQDGHVYQFISKWTFKNGYNIGIEFKGQRPSYWQCFLTLYDELRVFLSVKRKLKA